MNGQKGMITRPTTLSLNLNMGSNNFPYQNPPYFSNNLLSFVSNPSSHTSSEEQLSPFSAVSEIEQTLINESSFNDRNIPYPYNRPNNFAQPNVYDQPGQGLNTPYVSRLSPNLYSTHYQRSPHQRSPNWNARHQRSPNSNSKNQRSPNWNSKNQRSPNSNIGNQRSPNWNTKNQRSPNSNNGNQRSPNTNTKHQRSPNLDTTHWSPHWNKNKQRSPQPNTAQQSPHHIEQSPHNIEQSPHHMGQSPNSNGQSPRSPQQSPDSFQPSPILSQPLSDSSRSRHTSESSNPIVESPSYQNHKKKNNKHNSNNYNESPHHHHHHNNNHNNHNNHNNNNHNHNNNNNNNNKKKNKHNSNNYESSYNIYKRNLKNISIPLTYFPSCQIHKTHLRDFYCNNCSGQYCIECINEGHIGHTYEPSMSFQELLDEIDKNTHDANNVLLNIERQLAHLNFKQFAVCEDIRRNFQGLRDVLTAREAKLVTDTKYIVSCRAKILNTRMKEAQDLISDSIKISGLLGQSDPSHETPQSLQISRLARRHLQLLRNLNKNAYVEDEDVFFVSPEKDVYLSLRSIGAISSPSYVAANTCNNLQSSFESSVFSPISEDFKAATPTVTTNFNSASCKDFNGYNDMNGASDSNSFNGLNNFNGFNDVGNFNGMNGIHGNFGHDQQSNNLSFFDNNPPLNRFPGFTPPNFFNSPSVQQNLHNIALALASLPTPVESPNFSVLPSYPGTILSPYNPNIPSPRNGIVPNMSMNPNLSMNMYNMNRPQMNNSTANERAYNWVGMRINPDIESSHHSFPVSFHILRCYDRISKPVTVFGKEGSGDEDLCRPWGVCCDKFGHIIVADRSNNRIQIFRSDGSHVRHFGRHGTDAGEFNRPAGVAVDLYNRIVVCDKDNHRVQVFTIEGKFCFKFGERGAQLGKFHYPWDVDVAPTTGVYAISDTRNHRIQMFTDAGQFIRKFGFESASPTWKLFDAPRGVCFTQENTLLVTDFNNHRLFEVDFMSPQARMVRMENYKKCELYRPQKVTMDNDNNILVTDCRNNRIQVFNRRGEFIGNFGVAGKEEGQFDRPSGIAVTPDGKVVVVDFGNHRIQIF